PELERHPVAAIVKRAMAKAREERYQNTTELAADLHKAATGVPSRRISLPSMPAIPKVRVPKRTARVVGGILVALAAIIVVASAFSGHRATRYPEIAAMLDKGQPGDAREQIDRQLKEHPNDADLLLLRGHAM